MRPDDDARLKPAGRVGDEVYEMTVPPMAEGVLVAMAAPRLYVDVA
jgi:hypothetical protein